MNIDVLYVVSTTIRRGAGKRRVDGKSLRLADEVRYIQRRAADMTGASTEVNAQLRTEQRQDNKNTKNNQQPVTLKRGKLSSQYFWKQTHRNPPQGAAAGTD